MTPQTFYRKPFPVQAIRVSDENLFDVATWCDGAVQVTQPRSAGAGSTGQKSYVKVNVIHPKNVKQTMAFPGDWVLKAGNSFKVYSDKAFKDTFEGPINTDAIVQEDYQYGAVIGAQA